MKIRQLFILQSTLLKKMYLAIVFLLLPILVNAQLDQAYFQRLKTERVPSESDIEWKQFGPGNAGFSDFLRYHPTQPDVVVMGPDLFVVWQSENNGQSWFNIKDKDGNGEFQRLRDLYYSTSNENFGIAIESSQLWETNDMGKNWTIVQNAPWYDNDTDGSDRLGFISKVSSIAIDPLDDNTWYVGAGGHIRGESRFTTQSNVNAANPRGRENISFQGIAYQGSIYKTTNAGDSWTTLTSGIDSKAQFCRIIVNPSNNQEVFAASIDGLYKSTNGGTTWVNIGAGKLPNNTIVDMDFYYDATSDTFIVYLIDQVRYSPSGNTTTNTGGIFKTEDGGTTFIDITGDLYIDINQLTGGVPRNYDQYIANWFGISLDAAQSTYTVRPTNVLQYFNSLNVDPSRPDAIYVGFADAQIQNSIVPGRLWGTSNGGQKWTNIAREFGPAWQNDSAYWQSRGNPFNDNMEMGHEPFIQQFGQNYPLRSLRYCAVNNRGDIMIIAGHNTLLSTDNGTTFNQVDEDYTTAGNLMSRGNSNLPGESIFQDKRLGPNKPLMGSGEHRLWLLTDDGTNERQAARQIKNSVQTISSVVTHPLNKDIIFTTSYRQARKEKIVRSVDGGETFSDWGEATPAESQMRTQSLGIDPKNPDIMFFGVTDKEINDVTKEGGFYFSNDGGKTFAPRNNGLPTDVRIIDIKIDPRDQTNASYFAASQRQSFRQGNSSSPLAQGGLYFTSDRGLNWSKIEIDPAVTGVNRMVFDNTNRLYISSGHRQAFNETVTGGIWYTDDFGVNWTRVFDNGRTFSIDVSPFDNNLLVATVGFLQLNPGIYLSEDRGLTWRKNNIDGLNTEIRDVEFDTHDATTLWAVSLGNGFNRGSYAKGSESRVVKVTPFEIDLNSTDVETLQAQILSGGFSQSDITWSSSNTSIATVDQNGLVTAISIGQAKITALINNRYSDFAIVTVDAPEPPAQLFADGDYFIESPVNEQRLVALSSENFNARMGNKTSNDTEVWTLKHLANDVYTFQNKATSRYLEVENAVCGNSTNVTSGTENSETHQMFKIEENGSSYSIKPQHCLVQGVDRDFGAVDANVHTFFFDPNNINQQWKILPLNPLSVDLFSLEKITFGPNPAKQQITFFGVTEENIPIKIYDIRGRLLMTKKLNIGKTSIDVSKLSSGVYIISSKNNTWSKKLIKE